MSSSHSLENPHHECINKSFYSSISFITCSQDEHFCLGVWSCIHSAHFISDPCPKTCQGISLCYRPVCETQCQPGLHGPMVKANLNGSHGDQLFLFFSNLFPGSKVIALWLGIDSEIWINGGNAIRGSSLHCTNFHSIEIIQVFIVAMLP